MATKPTRGAGASPSKGGKPKPKTKTSPKTAAKGAPRPALKSAPKSATKSATQAAAKARLARLSHASVAQPVSERTRSSLLRFVDREGRAPTRRPAKHRAQDFSEIYEEYDPQAAAEQAARCSQCGVPFCQVHCPLENNIPDWLMLASNGRFREAYEASQSTNDFPEICGRICPQDRLCEGNCVIEQAGHGTVTIGAVERHLTDLAWENGWVESLAPSPSAERSESAAIIGAGPAGLAAAGQLRRAGVRVSIYDRHDRAGGLMMYGIPNFKLDKEIVRRRTAQLADAGVAFHLGVAVGEGACTLESLRAEHDAVFVATGAYRARALRAPGVGLEGVSPALDYLIASNRTGLGDAVPSFLDGTLNAANRSVVVVGGGDTAMDCVRTAVRQGARSVVCLYRRDRENMPGSRREVETAEEEGVRFSFLSSPTALDGKARVARIRVQPMALGEADADGRARVAEAPQSEARTLNTDFVLLALGFEPEPQPATLGAPDLETTDWGTVRVRWPSCATNLAGVFAGGDVVRGASLVVWAVRDGRDAAAGILEYLNARARSARAA